MADMLSDNIAIVMAIVALVLAMVTPLFSPLFRWKRRKEERADDGTLQPVSVIIASHDDARQLEKHLPAILQQDYPAGYEVIVVIEKGDHEVEDALKRIKHEHEQQGGPAHLYVTYIPETSRYMSRRKLAVTLGVKAAKNEWLLMTDSNCEPASSQWLALMARHCADDKTLVMGYTTYDDETSSFKRYEHFYHCCYLLREATNWAYRTNCPNVMFRKLLFMEQEGYLGNLELVRGEYDFLVNKYARQGATAVETAPQAWMVQDEPTRKSWVNKHVYYVESRKSLFRSFRHRAVFNTDQTVMRLCTCCIVAGVAYALLTTNWALLAAVVFAFVVEFALRCLIDSMAIKRFGEKFSLAAFYDHFMMWSALVFLLRHRCADRRNFTTHKQ